MSGLHRWDNNGNYVVKIIKNKKVTELTESIMERLEVRDSFGVSYFFRAFSSPTKATFKNSYVTRYDKDAVWRLIFKYYGAVKKINKKRRVIHYFHQVMVFRHVLSLLLPLDCSHRREVGNVLRQEWKLITLTAASVQQRFPQAVYLIHYHE